MLDPVMVGGLVAIGFLDEDCVVVGSHDGLGVIDTATGALVNRVADPGGDDAWFRESPPSALMSDQGVHRRVPVAGLWGGDLPTATADGWVCRVLRDGAELRGPDGKVVRIGDDEEARACGFSPRGQVFAFATPSALYLARRPT